MKGNRNFAGKAVLFKDNVTWQVNLFSQFYKFIEWEFWFRWSTFSFLSTNIPVSNNIEQFYSCTLLYLNMH